MTLSPWRERTDDIDRRAKDMVAKVHRALAVPGDRAALRRGLGQPPEHPSVRASHALVARFVRPYDDPATERAFYTVAALIAAQPRQAREEDTAKSLDAAVESADSDVHAATAPQPASGEAAPSPAAPAQPGMRRLTNLGVTLARAVNDRKLSEQTTEARLHLLCRQNLDGVHRHLPRLVAHLRVDLVPVDWVQLIADLSRWNTAGDFVAKQWLQAYHRTLTTNPTTDAAHTDPSDEETP